MRPKPENFTVSVALKPLFVSIRVHSRSHQKIVARTFLLVDARLNARSNAGQGFARLAQPILK
jgi:hypothetical protein